MKIFLLSLLLAAPAAAQDITDVQAIVTAALGASAVLASPTGTDGATCTLSKIAGPTIFVLWKCTDTSGKNVIKSSPIISTGAGATAVATRAFEGMGSIVCIIGINPTATAVSFGSFGTAPPVGVTWACAPGDGTQKTGTAVWP